MTTVEPHKPSRPFLAALGLVGATPVAVVLSSFFFPSLHRITLINTGTSCVQVCVEGTCMESCPGHKQREMSFRMLAGGPFDMRPYNVTVRNALGESSWRCTSVGSAKKDWAHTFFVAVDSAGEPQVSWQDTTRPNSSRPKECTRSSREGLRVTP